MPETQDLVEIASVPAVPELYTCATVTTGAQVWSSITEAGDQPWTAGVGCANWIDQQWAASFRNVPFCVDADTRTGGRRIQVHEFPSREDWLNEDLGRLRQQIDVQGYVFGDRSDEWAELLFAACTAKQTSAELYLPMRVPLLCVCQTVESSFSAEQMGRLNFRMSFSIDPLGYTEGWLRRVPSIVKPVSSVMVESAVVEAAKLMISEAQRVFDVEFTTT